MAHDGCCNNNLPQNCPNLTRNLPENSLIRDFERSEIAICVKMSNLGPEGERQDTQGVNAKEVAPVRLTSVS
jgi:hypothetical protein